GLSACNTAAGDVPGAEALSGLARAFFYAGTRALLVSHWPVYSHAAVRLTTKTFQALRADAKLGRVKCTQACNAGLLGRCEESSELRPKSVGTVQHCGRGFVAIV